MKIFHIDYNHELVKTNRVQTFLRFLLWQGKSRISRRDFIFKWIEDSKFYVKNGETGLTQNIYVGLAEFEDMSFLLHCLQENDFFFDIGSNSGSYSILGGAVVGANVVAVEPVRETFERLLRNLVLNRLESSSTALNVALGAKSGFLTMTSSLDTTNQIVVGETLVATTQVEIKTLDEISVNMSPSLIKIDVEGWATEVLRGGFNTLQSPNLLGLIIELNESGLRYGFSDAGILDLLRGFGFEPHAYDPFSRSLTRLDGKNPKGVNTIFIRNKVEIAKRIEIAPKREILRLTI
jgi:FkbM family methyltransferase